MKKPKPLPRWEVDALAVRQCVYQRTPVDTEVMLKVLDDLLRRARKAARATLTLDPVPTRRPK